MQRGSPDMLATIFQIAKCSNLEHGLYKCCCENLKSHNEILISCSHYKDGMYNELCSTRLSISIYKYWVFSIM
jgi:hypothetical protein